MERCIIRRLGGRNVIRGLFKLDVVESHAEGYIYMIMKITIMIWLID